MILNRHNIKVFLVLLLGVIIVLVPLFLNSGNYLSTSNDLNNFFKPLIIYSKNSILNKGVFPLWNPLWFGGMPLVSDPQNPLSYFPNIIFLFGDVNKMLVVSIFTHLLLGALFFYKFARSIGLNSRSSLISSLLYVGGVRYAASLQAGHLGIIYSFTWIPLFLFMLQRLSKKFSLAGIITLTIVTALLFISHEITGSIVIISGSAITFLFTHKKKQLIVSILTSFILSAMILSPFILPQLLWQEQTTRALLITHPDTYPKWAGKREFLQAIISLPNELNTEKAITIGVFPLVVTILAVKQQKRTVKVYILMAAAVIILVVTNNVSPIYELLTKLKPYDILRVATRFWILFSISIPILCGVYLNKLKDKRYFGIISLALIINTFFISQTLLNKVETYKPILPQNIENLFINNSSYRVYCPTQCFDPSFLAQNNINSINGYATLVQKNFYTKSWGLFGGYWDYYTLAIPPFGAPKFQTLKPDLKALGEYNVKYIVNETDGNFSVQLNQYTKGLAYSADDGLNTQQLQILQENSNLIRVNVNEHLYTYLVLSKTYAKGWKAFTDKGQEVSVSENPSSLIQVRVPSDANFIEFMFEPPGWKEGLLLFKFALGLIIATSIFVFRNNKYFQGILISVFTLVFFLGLGEIGLRLYFNSKDLRTTLHWRDDPILGRRLIPNQKGLFVSNTFEYKQAVEINSSGFRDTEHLLSKDKDTFRIILLGDSFVENFQVPLDQTIFKRLERNLSSKLNKKIEVIALGLGDTGTAQQLLLLRDIGLKYKPDMVVQLFFSGNDVKNNSLSLMGDAYRPYFILDNNKLTLNSFPVRSDNLFYKWLSVLKNNSVLLTTVLNKKGEIKTKVDSMPNDYEVYRKTPSPEYKSAWNVTEELLAETQNLTKKAGANYVLVALANNEQVNLEVKNTLVNKYKDLGGDNFSFENPDNILKSICLNRKLVCFFMLPVFSDFIGKNPDTVTHYKYDGHLNEKGTNIASDFLTEKLAPLIKN